MPLKLTNNAIATLASPITNSETDLTLTPGTGARFPTLDVDDWCPATLIKLVSGTPTYEIVKVTARSTDVLTVERAQEGTTALAFSAGDRVELRPTAAVFDEYVPNGTVVTPTGTQTLTNKTIDLTDNTLTGTVAEFNAALSDGDFATLDGEETLTDKTLVDPILTLDSTEGAAGQVPVSQGEGLPPVWTTISSVQSNFQEFTSSGTWTKPAGATWVYVEAIAAGGSGANNTGTTASGASGGEFVSRLMRASDCSATETVTVGAGATGAPSGATANGSDGGNSSFGSLVVAIGGNGGTTSNAQFAAIPRATVKTTSASNYPSTTAVFPQSGHGGSTAPLAGGNTIYGGAGGGGAATGSSAAGGASQYGGNGGAGDHTAATKAGNGVAPGGGGGGSTNDGGGGDGANGRVRVWCW